MNFLHHSSRLNYRLVANVLLAIALICAPGVARASTVSTFDVLVATNNLTAVGTATVQGSAFSVGASTLIVADGSILIGTTTERGQLHMVGPTLESSAPEFVWFASSAALRVGRTFDAGVWDPGNIGHFSMALGSNNFARGRGAFVGGINNYAYADYGAIAGGLSNEVDDQTTVVGGGANNIASYQFASILGGEYNLASGNLSTIGGGYVNVVSSDEATVPGGLGNTASGLRSFAAGHSAYAEAPGAFVWADDENIPLHSTVENEFKARAGGGFVLLGTPTSPTVIVSSGALMISTSATAAAAVPNIFISSTNGRVGIGTKTPGTTLDVSGNITALSSVTASAFFGDGSHLSGLPTGDVTAAGNNAFTGANSEAGSLTLLSGSTWTIHPNTITGNWIFVSSADTTGSNNVANTTHTITLSNYTADTSSVSWWVHYECMPSSAVLLLASFNADSGAKYNYSSTAVNSAGTVLWDGGTADRAIDLTPQSNASSSLSTSMSLRGDIFFQTARGNTNNVSWDAKGTSYRNGYMGFFSGGLYSGSAALSSISFHGGVYTTSMTGVFIAPSGFVNCHTDLFRQGYQSQ